jgi:hypothetical protein
MTHPTYNDYDQFVVLDLEDVIEDRYKCNRPIYYHIAARYNNPISIDNPNTADDYWINAIPVHAIGLFVFGVTLYIIF